MFSYLSFIVLLCYSAYVVSSIIVFLLYYTGPFYNFACHTTFAPLTVLHPILCFTFQLDLLP